MSYLNIQKRMQQQNYQQNRSKNKFIPPPPPLNSYNSSQKQASFKSHPYQNQFSRPYNNHPNQTFVPNPSQKFFEPIYKVPPPNFDGQGLDEYNKNNEVCQEKEQYTVTRQENNTYNPLDIQVANQENLQFLSNKGIFKIKLGAVYTKKDRIPDDFQCFIQLIQSIFPCLLPGFEQPLNKLLSKQQKQALKLEEMAVSQLVSKEDKFYKVFYLNSDDKPINIRNAQDYGELILQLAKNKSLVHPIHGLKIFIIPKQGDSFLQRFSLGGEREVELNQQVWKLLFTDNNYISNLRVENHIKKPKDLDSDNLEVMRELLIGELEESLLAVDINEEDHSHKELDQQSDSNEKEQKKEDAKNEELDQFSIVDRVSQPQFIEKIKKNLAKEDDAEMAQQNLELLQDDQDQEEQSDSSSECQSDIDQQAIRNTAREQIDTYCEQLFQQMYIQNFNQDIKLEQMENLILSQLFVKHQDQEVDSIPPISFQEINYQQLYEADIQIILNPFELQQQKDDENEVEEKENQLKKSSEIREESKENIQLHRNQQLPENEQLQEDPQLQEKNQVEKQNLVQHQAVYPIPQQGIIIQPAVQPFQEMKKNDQKEVELHEEKNQLNNQEKNDIPLNFEMMFQPKDSQQIIQQPIFYQKEQIPLVAQLLQQQQMKGQNYFPQYIPPPSQAQLAKHDRKQNEKISFFKKMKQSAVEFLNAIKGGDEKKQKKKYQWAPMQMAAIIRQISSQTDLIDANAE